MSALQFSYSPPELIFDESGCKMVEIRASREIEFYLVDYWSASPSFYIQDYNLTRPEDLVITYPSILTLDKEDEFEVCASFDMSHNGVLVVYSDDSSFAPGIWVRLESKYTNLSQNLNVQSDSKYLILTGKAVEENIGKLPKKLVIFESIFLSFCLVIILVLANVILKKTK